MEYQYVNHNSHHGNSFSFLSSPEWECSIPIQVYQYVNHNSHHGNSFLCYQVQNWKVLRISILVFMEYQYVNHISHHGNYFIPQWECFSSSWFLLALPVSRVHNISIEGECLIAYIPCTNALHQVTPVNYRVLSDLINT